MSKATKADHAIRVLNGARLEVAGDAIRFSFPDNSIMGLLVEEGERTLTGIEHFEKALRYIEWLIDNKIMTSAEYKRVDDRIMRMARNPDANKVRI
jgi:hypothetical protein